ncbi:MAG: dipeptide epimerase [Myxococcota bacterium]
MGHPTRIQAVSLTDLDVALTEPFGIATGAQTRAENLLVTLTLDDGTRGHGEAAPFPAVNGETRALARAELEAAIPQLHGLDVRAWRSIAPVLKQLLPRSASARCAVETAMLDALTRHHRIPLWVFFGGAATGLVTDMTITTGTVEHARRAAARIEREGFHVIKLKVGGVPLEEDVERAVAVLSAAPQCGLLLDANAGMKSPAEVFALLDAIRGAGGRVVLFEQPLARNDLRGMREVTERAGVPVAADESVGSLADLHRVVAEKAANVVNIKIMKSGLVDALELITVARAHGLGLMIGGMVETQLAMTTSACLAAGMGGFSFVDLDTPRWMVDAPLRGGFLERGPALDLHPVTAGHGVDPL